jgi:hypothetical protein
MFVDVEITWDPAVILSVSHHVQILFYFLFHTIRISISKFEVSYL